ncbi:MAG: TonB family protein, partial [Chitinophagaceae bacterium]|nr:TonB family protein [Chitinophagaceae bacterium]
EAESAAKIEGKVVVQFTIDQTGAIGDVKAVRIPAQGENLGKEAVRVVRSMPKWKPGKQAGKPVKVNYTLPVDFKLK